MQVRELMTESPAMCTRDTSLQEVAQMMVEHDCGAIPIVEDAGSRKAVGIVTDRDVMTRLVAKGQNPIQKQASDAMTNAVVTVRPEDSVERCAQIMEDKQVRRLVVADDRGACVGIVAQADLARRGRDRMTGEVVEEISQPTH